MKLKKFLLVLFLCVIISSAVSYIFFSYQYRQLSKYEIDMYLEVTDKDKAFGINIDTDALYFGYLPYGGGATRRINITNHYDRPVSVYILKDDSMLADLIYIQEDNFFLEAKENRLVPIKVSVPKSFYSGNFSGTLTVDIRNVPFYTR